MDKNKFWEIKQSAVPKTLDLYIYSAVEEDYFDYDYETHSWAKKQSETSADYFREQLEGFGEVDNINIYINSMGGSVYEGISIYNQLKRCKAYKTVYIDGFACSIASVIAMSGDKIIMPRNTLMMIHKPWVYVSGNDDQLRKAADDLAVLNEASIEAYLGKCGQDKREQIQQMMLKETYLTAMKCIELGLANEFAEVDADIEQAKQMLAQAKQNNMNIYANKLEKIYAMAKPLEPQQKPQEPAFEQKATAIINNFFNTKG